ncbi:PE-PGRS family protein [Streptomyces albofaciens JCM 4342]|uniref:PE-PGRS family protein n=1 Tax=Streptomyces albofaciens TaxID=66866 RepID=UPI0012399397|nr:PE-PGRS family protein [Streptomyces albofaciens]KAA6222123.1 PE-PGRS family protein [Streptomyces albofaciens JCM 4342]
MIAGRVLRGLRAGVFAAVCVLLAALGHALMSDAPVPVWVVLGAVAVTACGAWCLAARERGPLFVTALTLTAQAVLHTAFSFGQSVAAGLSAAGAGVGGDQVSLAQRWAASLVCGMGGRPMPQHDAEQLLNDVGLGRRYGEAMAGMPATHHMHTGHDMPGMHDMTGMDGNMTGMDGSMTGMGGSMTGMLAAHVLVALLSAWWLCGGERAAFRVVRAVSVRLFVPLVLVLRAVLPEPPRPARPVRREPRRPLRRLLLVHVIWLRGPPRETAVC